MRTGMPVRYDNPREVGADRIVNAVAAFELFGGPTIAVDFGTATTFDVVSRKGEYLGGVIFPGVQISLEALFKHTAKLPRIDMLAPENVIGKSTVDSIRSGAVHGFTGMVENLVRQIKTELGQNAQVVATGGIVEWIASNTTVIDTLDPFLTLDGMRIIYEKNHPEN
jgi:type III pantothenate kinase